MLVNLYATTRDLPEVSFQHTLNSRRDLSDPALPKHLEGFCGYVFKTGGGKMNAHLYHLIQHIERVRHHLSLWVEADLLEELCAWANRANALMFYEDGSVRDPNGLMLLDPQTGGHDPEATLPFPADALERKARSERELELLGIHVPQSLPPTVSSQEVLVRPAAEVARRALALLVVAVRAESMNEGDPLSVSDLRARAPRGIEALTPKEKAFLESDSPTPQEVVNHVWRHEALNLLLWAIRLMPELPLPVAICDVQATVKAALSRKGDRLIADAELRPVAEILDVADMHYRLHWAVRDAAHVGNQPPPASLEPGVVAERRHALNWLLRFQDADWDDVDTPT